MNFDNYKPVIDHDALEYIDSLLDTKKNLKAELESELEIVNDSIKDLNSQRRNIYATANSIQYNRFKADAFREVGLTDHPKAEDIWAKAWDRGHSGGYSEVFLYLEELADLVLN